MTAKNPLPALEEILTANEIEEAKANVRKLTQDAYQPVLNALIQRFHPTAKAVVTADVTLGLAMEHGQPVLTNNISVGVDFIPAKSYDLFEEANRVIIREMFAHLLKK